MSPSSAGGVDAVRFAAFASAALMMAQQVAGKATRDALFLSNFPATDLPPAMAAAGVIALLSALVVSRALARLGPTLLVPVAFAASGAAFVVEWWLLDAYPGGVAIALYLHVATFGAILISGFWSVVSERFDAYTGKATIARTAAYASLGGVIGGLGAERLSTWFGLDVLFPAMAALHALCALGVLWIGGPESPAHPAQASANAPASGVALIRRTPYLQQLILLAALCAIVEAVLDYVLKFEAARHFESGTSLLQFFALFYTATGLLGFLLQASLGPGLLRRFGLRAVLPVRSGLVVVLGLGAALVGGFWSVAVLRAGEALAAGSLFRSSFELLYNPLARETRRATKTIIDVAGQRAGDIFGAGLVLWVLLLAPQVSTPTWIGIAVFGSLAILVLVFQLGRAYTTELSRSLRSGSVSFDSSDSLDATTARSLAESHVKMNRGELLRRIEEYEPETAAQEAAPADADELVAEFEPAPEDLALLEKLRRLYSGDAAEARAVLAARPEDVRLVPHVTGLLLGPLGAQAEQFLRRVAPRAIGSLCDVLTDPERPDALRERIPAILESCTDARAAEGLVRGLADRDFAVRLASGRAAARIVQRAPKLRLPDSEAYAIVRRELEGGRSLVEGRRRAPGDAGRSAILPRGYAERVPVGIEHLFTLLSLALEPSLVRSALQGLYAGDTGLRGTALEFLETVLPERERRELWPLLHERDSGAEGRAQRDADEVAEELLRTAAALDVDPDRIS